jgi:hypothetical protein
MNEPVRPDRPRQPARQSGSRYHFDPARLFLGLSLLMLAGAFAARTAGELEIRLRVLAAALPAALVATAVIAITTHLIRRRGG